MRVLRLKLFQETACYKKPYAAKVSETYPLPPFSTVIGMLHHLLEAPSGSIIPMKLCIQGEWDSLFSDYQKHYFIKEKNTTEFPLVLDGLAEGLNHVELSDMTSMPIYRHLLYRINLLIYISAEDDVLEAIYQAFHYHAKTLSLGRAEDLLRVDACEFVELSTLDGDSVDLLYNAYVPRCFIDDENDPYVPYRLNSIYKIVKNIRKWEKVAVGYMSKGVTLEPDVEGLLVDNFDEKPCPVFFYD